MSIPTQPDDYSLREDMREMFDGMRACHQSEISHTNHAITMLLAIAGAAGATVLAMLIRDNPLAHPTGIAWGLCIVVIFLSGTIAVTSYLKITADHKNYETFGEEYVKVTKLLGFYENVQIKNETIKIKTHENIDQGKGYQKTQWIILGFATEISCFALLFAIILS